MQTDNYIGTDLCAGCAEWWDANIHRDEQYFTYAHPVEKEE